MFNDLYDGYLLPLCVHQLSAGILTGERHNGSLKLKQSISENKNKGSNRLTFEKNEKSADFRQNF